MDLIALAQMNQLPQPMLQESTSPADPVLKATKATVPPNVLVRNSPPSVPTVFNEH